MPAFGLAWDHGKRRVLFALVALVAVLAVAASSLGGIATVDAARGETRSTVRTPIERVDPGGVQTLAVTWG